MRRITLALAVFCAMTSLIVAVAAIVLTARSYYVCDMFWYDRPIWSLFVLTADGQTRLECDTSHRSEMGQFESWIPT